MNFDIASQLGGFPTASQNIGLPRRRDLVCTVDLSAAGHANGASRGWPAT